MLLSCLSLAGAPFVLILEQINVGPGGGGAPVPWILLGSQVAVSAAFIYLGSQILKGNGLARWGFIAFGAFVLLAAFAIFKALYVIPGVVVYLVFTALLFQRKANRFF